MILIIYACMLFLGLSLILLGFFSTVSPFIDYVFEDKELERQQYREMLDKKINGTNIYDLHKNQIDNDYFERSSEKYYNFTRAWNYTMYNELNNTFSGIPHHWWTGLTVNRIGEIDTVSGTYEMDLNYWVQIFEKDDPAKFSIEEIEKLEPNFVDFVNLVNEPTAIELAKGAIHKEHYHEISLTGTFYTDMDFKKFPFEKLILPISVEPNYNYTEGSHSDLIQFHRWPYKVLESEKIPSPGYEIVGYNVTVADNKYSEGDIYSRYTVNVEVQREVLGSFLKFVFPVIIMAGLALVSLLVPSGEYMTKIEYNAIFFLGILFFVQIVAEEIPATGDMTVFDYVVMMCYATIIVTILTPGIKWKNERKFERDLEDKEWWDAEQSEKIKKIESKIQMLEMQKIVAQEKNKEEIKEEISKKQKEIEKIEALRGDVLVKKILDMEELERAILVKELEALKGDDLVKKIQELGGENIIQEIESIVSPTFHWGKEANHEKNLVSKTKSKVMNRWLRLIIKFDEISAREEKSILYRKYNRYASYAVISIIGIGVSMMVFLT